MAVGLGSVDMPVPSIAEWEWLNWSFPRQVYAGDTVYARWTLTQKRPPGAGAASSIVVWRVDVHTADGALCAEGEIGAKVKREPRQAGVKLQPAVAGPAAGAPPAAAGSRRRRHRSRTNGTAPEPPAVAAPPAPAAKPERAAGPSRRRRRRRSGGTAAQQEEHEPRAAHVAEHAAERVPEPAPPAVQPPPTPSSAPARGSKEGGIGRVLKRLRRS